MNPGEKLYGQCCRLLGSMGIIKTEVPDWTHLITAEQINWRCIAEGLPTESATPVSPSEDTLPEKVSAVQKRGAGKYGDVRSMNEAYGLVITGILQAHYGIVLDHPIPGWIALDICVAGKLMRHSRSGWREDDGIDLISYADLADRLKKEEGTE